MNHESLIISHQSSAISHQSSIIHHQSSVVSHPSSVVSHPSSVISHPSSVISHLFFCVTLNEGESHARENSKSNAGGGEGERATKQGHPKHKTMHVLQTQDTHRIGRAPRPGSQTQEGPHRTRTTHRNEAPQYEAWGRVGSFLRLPKAEPWG